MGNLHILHGTSARCFFELKERAKYIDRCLKNDVQIDDGTVSRRRPKIPKMMAKYFLTDPGSRNRTFFNGNYPVPGIGVQIALQLSCFLESLRKDDKNSKAGWI